MDEEKAYSTVRDLLGDFLGCTLVDISQQDYEDYKQDGRAYIYLHFSNGRSMYVELNGDDAPNFMYDDESSPV